jgi:Alginate export
MFSLHLPPSFKIGPVFEHRTRFERRTDQDLSKAKNDNKSQLLDRERFGFDVTYDNHWSGEFRYQYSHNLNWTAPRNFSEENRDVLLAHVDYALRAGEKVSVGRQFVRSGRLFDPSEFGQRSKVFDIVRYQTKKLDLWAGRVGTTTVATDHSKLASAAYSSAVGKSTLTFKRDDQAADISTYTFDHQFSGKTKHYAYELEGALQFGKTGGKDVNAFYLHTRAMRPISSRLAAYAEANLASGGGNSKQTRTFDPLYFSAHGPYGLLDVQGPRNFKNIEVGLTYQLKRNLSGMVSVNNYSLYDESDGWYNNSAINKRPGGAFIDATGKSGRDIGNEFDLGISYVANQHSSFVVEAGYFKPGNFVRAFNGAATTDEYWVGVTYGYKF